MDPRQCPGLTWVHPQAFPLQVAEMTVPLLLSRPTLRVLPSEEKFPFSLKNKRPF